MLVDRDATVLIVQDDRDPADRPHRTRHDEVEIDYGDSLTEVVARLHAARDTLSLATLDTLLPAPSIRYRRAGARWKKLKAPRRAK